LPRGYAHAGLPLLEARCRHTSHSFGLGR
jgi:hypothetical protein